MAGALPRLRGITWGGPDDFPRGFVEEVGARSLQVLREHAARIRQTIPLRKVRLRVGRDFKDFDADCLTGLAGLHVWGGPLGDAGVAALANCPHLSGLRMLSVSNHGFGRAGARALAGSPHLGRLTHLSLEQNSIGVAGTRALRERFGGAVRL